GRRKRAAKAKVRAWCCRSASAATRSGGEPRIDCRERGHCTVSSAESSATHAYLSGRQRKRGAKRRARGGGEPLCHSGKRRAGHTSSRRRVQRDGRPSGQRNGLV